MATKMQKRVSLDWSRLLGFDQADKAVRRARPAAGKGPASRLRLASLGSKVGVKEGVKRSPR